MRRTTVMAVALLACGASAHAALFGVATYASFGTQGLYEIDATNGQASLIGNTGLTQINGIAFDASQGRMYGLTTSGEVHLISLQTGASLLLSDSNTIVPEGDIAFLNGQLYSVNGGSLITIDPTSGVITSVGTMGAAANDISGLVVDGSGRLLGYSKNGTLADTLVSIDTVSGLASTIGELGVNNGSGVGGLTFDALSGTLFLTESTGLFTVNPLTGAASFVGSHGPAGFSGLSIPTPGTASLLALGIITLRRRR